MKNTFEIKTPNGFPNFSIIANWKDVLKRAWSVRFIALIIVMASAGPALPFIDEVVHIPRLLYAIAIITTGVAALVARFIPQEGITDGGV